MTDMEHKYNTRLKNNKISRVNYEDLDDNNTEENNEIIDDKVSQEINEEHVNKKPKIIRNLPVKSMLSGCDNNKINIIINMKDGNNNIYNADNPQKKQSIIDFIKEKFDDEQELDKSENGDDDDSEDGDNEFSDNHLSRSKHDDNSDDEDGAISPKSEHVDNTEFGAISPKSEHGNNNKKKSKKNYNKICALMGNEDMNEEYDYFVKNVSNKDQLKYIKQIKHLQKINENQKPMLINVLELDIPEMYKKIMLNKLSTFRGLTTFNNEYFKLKSWIDTFMKIPFNKYANLPITYADGPEKCTEFLNNAKDLLDSIVYGLHDAKIQIIQLLGLYLVNPNAVGTSIGIKGPPGTGKTSLIIGGLSKILQRPHGYVALGGNQDSCYLVGHDYTYEGSKYGKILDILIQTGVSNPIIMFDELDKVSDSHRGDEIIGILTHLIDTTQNSCFEDKYMCDFKIDLSKSLFVFTYNDESVINKILLDRMYKVETTGYNTNDKIIIANKYLIPAILKEIRFKDDDVVLSEEIIKHIIDNYTQGEAGVRNLKRCLEILYTKLNLCKICNMESTSFELIKTKNIKFPINVTTQIIDDFIKRPASEKLPFGMYT